MADRRILVLSSGYSLDFSQIARILSYLEDARGSGKGLRTKAELADAVGSSVERVERLRKLGAAMGIFERRSLRLTPLGSMVTDFDPYFDDLGTLWLLHYLIGSQAHLYVWNRLVNEVVAHNRTFSFDAAKHAFGDAPSLYAGSTVMKRVQKEITTFLNAYTQQKFAHLQYIREEQAHMYFCGTQEPISPSVFFSAVVSYRQRFSPGAATLDIALLSDEANSPGRVFNLTEREVRDLLEDVEKLGYVYVESRAALDQIRFRDNYDLVDVVRNYYEEH